MEKYKSDLIKDIDIRIDVDRRWISDTRLEIVKIKHLPSGISISVEDRSQLKAYNIALKALEKKLKEKNNLLKLGEKVRRESNERKSYLQQ